MKVLHVVIGLLTIHLVNGQTPNQKDLTEILNVALLDKKLPDELIVKSNPKMAPWTNAPFVVVKSDSTMNLERPDVPPDSTHVWIFDYEDIFMLDIAFGLAPVSIVYEQDRFTLKYKTVKYPTKNTEMTCHLGQIVAEKKDDSWTIIKSRTRKTKCKLDMFGQKK